MRRAKIVLLRLDYLLGTAIIICQILYIRQMVSILFYLSFLVSIALWICTTTESLDRLDRLTIAIIMLALIHVAINAAITDAVFSFHVFLPKSADAPAQWQIYTLPYLPL